MSQTNKLVPKQGTGKRAFAFIRPQAAGEQTTLPQVNSQVNEVANRTIPATKPTTRNYVFAQYVVIKSVL
jgi:hypothetical protein